MVNIPETPETVRNIPSTFLLEESLMQTTRALLNVKYGRPILLQG